MSDTTSRLTDGQARAVIVAAEHHGFERSPDRYVRWYDAELHEDAVDAAAFLSADHPDVLAAALVADDPITPERAARRIGAKGITIALMDDIVRAASRRGFTPPEQDLPPLLSVGEYEQGIAAIEFLWHNDRDALRGLIGDDVLLAPIPETARRPCRCSIRDETDYY